MIVNMEGKDPFILHDQYHGYWWTGGEMSHGITRGGGY